MRVFIFFCFLPLSVCSQLRFPERQVILSETQAMIQFIETLPMMQANKDLSVQWSDHHASQHSIHVRFALAYKQIPVFNKFITLHLSSSNQLLSYDIACEGIAQLQHYDPEEAFEAWSKVHPEKLVQAKPEFFNHIKTSFLKIYVDEDEPELILAAEAWSKTYDRTLLLRYDGQIVKEINHERNFTDTLIQAKVFNPDPLTTLQHQYNAQYKDDNDQHMPWMDSALQLVTIPVVYSNGIFYLENGLVKLEEFENPVADPVTQTTPDFFYTRNQSGFEDVQVMYHLTTFHDYISSLGYDSLLIDGITVDAHAQMGADNSVFSRNGGNPTLRFGIGGVDDAEDADVLIHEYAHGLSWSANGNDNFTNERSGLDEGLADYFASSYSRSIHPFQWDKVFSWDGHNEFWDGRTANQPLNYPYSGSFYTLGEIWNTAMSTIATDLGLIVADKLMLEALYFFGNETTLPQAAMYVLQADTLLFGGLHTTTICNRFQQKNILDANCKPLSTTSTEGVAQQVTVYNSLAFAQGEGMLKVQVPDAQPTTFVLYSSLGHCVQRITKQNGEIIISPQSISSGNYYLQCITDKNSYQIKFQKF